ncbi:MULTISPECIES: hypothetical protein [unclassified Flavobacterium]|uniref:hypothetical protein n=1 Tax=unclassified Flavobacterium TaxID=196869 RepID=UPI001F142BD8|nr:MULTISPECIES: hypothetical protein [unclassified Flavobacterium]UMY66764.1 hypothetical protein MKO97_05110 [Flavobacterium sp. HJ-32-4]HLN94230.1 hypothetical protein [Flavobacterium sp.]
MTLEQLKKMMRYGDYATLSRMLEINPEAAKMRLLRGDAKAMEAMQLLIESREKLIRDYIDSKEGARLGNTP